MTDYIVAVIDYGPTWLLAIGVLIAFVVMHHERATYSRRDRRNSDRLRRR